MAGRAYLHGLAAARQAGVDHILDLFATDMKRTMALIGSTTIEDINRDHVTVNR